MTYFRALSYFGTGKTLFYDLASSAKSSWKSMKSSLFIKHLAVTSIVVRKSLFVFYIASGKLGVRRYHDLENIESR